MTTLEAITEAMQIENKAAAKYREFAEIAQKEGEQTAAELFDELARVKELHADILKSTTDTEGGCDDGGCGTCETGCSTQV